jgi:NTE family protein
LQGLQQLGYISAEQQPFDIFVGTSAGSLNCTMLAAYSDRPDLGVQEMSQVWSRLRASQVFRTGAWAVAANALGWARDLALGGLLGRVSPRSLLDTGPMPRLLEQLPWGRLAANLEAGHFEALGVLATNYTTSNGEFFLQDRGQHPLWQRVRYQVRRVPIGVPQLLASSAIPIVFPAVPWEGCYYGDGSLRNTAPLGPAIQLGAERIVAVGVREAGNPAGAARPGRPPKLADIAGVLLDAVLLDAIEIDVQHCLRLNQLAQAPGSNFRPVEVLWLRPSQNLAHLALRLENRIPPVVRYLLRGLGDPVASAELASYLIFDGEYCGLLMEQGRKDVLAREAEVATFFSKTPQARP